MAINFTKIFTDLGRLVYIRNAIKSARDAVDGYSEEVDTVLDDNGSELDLKGQVLLTLQSTKASFDSQKTAMESRGDKYISDILPNLIGSTSSTIAAKVDDLITAMTNNSETVKANGVSVLPGYTIANDGESQIADIDSLTGLTSSGIDAAGKIYITISDEGGGSRKVSIYNASAKGAGDKIAESAVYSTTGEKTLSEANSSGVGGTINIGAVGSADADIEITFAFAGTRTGTETLDSWSATQQAVNGRYIRIECIDATTPGAELWRVYYRDSDDTTPTTATEQATTGVAYPADTDQAGVAFTINYSPEYGSDIAVGDTFELQLVSDDDGVWLSYFRDRFGVSLPNVSDGSETIDDALAE